MTRILEHVHNTESPLIRYNDEALQQIRDRRYALNFDGKLGEEPKCTGRILAVGIAYDRKDKQKRHMCKVEVVREAL